MMIILVISAVLPRRELHVALFLETRSLSGNFRSQLLL